MPLLKVMEKGTQLKPENGKSISAPTKGFIDVLQTVQGLPSFKTAEGMKNPINPMSMAFDDHFIIGLFNIFLLDFLTRLYKVYLYV